MRSKYMWSALALAMRCRSCRERCAGCAALQRQLIGVPKAELSISSAETPTTLARPSSPLVTSKQPATSVTEPVYPGWHADRLRRRIGPDVLTRAPGGRCGSISTEQRHISDHRPRCRRWRGRISIPVDPADGNAVLVDQRARVRQARWVCRDQRLRVWTRPVFNGTRAQSS